MSISFFTKKHTSKKKFPIGTYCKVNVPKSTDSYYDSIRDATVKVVSRKDYVAKYPKFKIPKNTVICMILDAPNAPEPKIRSNLIGFRYPISRSWLSIEKKKHKCDCDMRTVLMVSGCRCGGY